MQESGEHELHNKVLERDDLHQQKAVVIMKGWVFRAFALLGLGL